MAPMSWQKCGLPSSVPRSLRTVDGFLAQTDCDTLRFLQPLSSCQIRQGYWIGQAAPDRDNNAETSLLWSTGSDTCVCHSQDARRCFDEGPGDLSFVACSDERTPLRVRDIRFQHKCEENLTDALRACAKSQIGDWISADTISRTAIWKTWSEHSLNPLENAVSKIGIFVSSVRDLNMTTFLSSQF